MQMFTEHPDLLTAFKREACFTLDYSGDRMLHVVEQLTDEQIWSRPHPDMNTIGNILLHVCGNMRQWLVVGLTDQPDTRDRRGEFAQRDPIPRGELVAGLLATVDEAKAAIMNSGERALLDGTAIQGFKTTGSGAVFHSVSHLEGHAQETIYAGRLILGDAYRFKDVY